MGLEITLYRADQCKDFYNLLLLSYAWHVFLVYDIYCGQVYYANNYNLRV